MRLEPFLPLLRCPACGDELHAADNGVNCGQRHHFDVAKQGYVNLSGRGQPANADTTEMVAARLRFLSRGHFRPVVDELLRQLPDDAAPTWLEAGAGPGWYLAQLLQARPGARALAADVSVPAVRRAARAHDRMAAVVFDTWRPWPVVDHAADAVMTIFAPRQPAEFHRVLRPGGVLLVVAPTARHLASLRERHGLLTIDKEKDAAVTASLPAGLLAEDAVTVESSLTLSADDVVDVIGMGPNAHHRPTVDAESIHTDLSVTVSRWRRAR